MFHLIKSGPELSQAISSTYLFDIAIAIVLICIMLIVVNLISWKGVNSKDVSGAQRRVWFFVFMVVTLVGSLAFNYFAWMKHIAVPAFVSKYTVAMIVASFAAMAVYFGVAFLVVKIARIGSKTQSIFPKRDR